MRLLFFLLMLAVAAPAIAKTPAIAMYGEPKYGEDFTHFEYVNPNAPKGGKVKLAVVGSFDSLNSHILQGVAAAGLSSIYDTLMVSSDDEPFSRYGLLAESLTLAPDRSWVEFTLRKQARWHDGVKISADDVVFSFNILTTKGHPFMRAYYRDVKRAEKISEYKVRFVFADNTNRELPLIVGDMPILPKHYWLADGNDFTATTLTPPLGSGPYKIDAVEAGKWIRYKRVDNYWAKDLPVNKGRYNFDEIKYDYYRDATVAVEAFKAGEYDFREENISKVWHNAYNIEAVDLGVIKKEEVPHHIPTGMQGFVFNTRLAKFKAPLVRKALNYSFDFEWTNKNLFNGAYSRTESYFSNSDFAAKGKISAEERKLLEPFKNELPPELFESEFHTPKGDGSGNNRKNLLIARDILSSAGWQIKNGALTNERSGEVMKIEFLLVSPSFERVIAPIIQNMKKLGIAATMRTVDSAQYIKRMEDFDFDIIVSVFGQSNAPGNEQIDYWHSSKADVKGSRNLAGIKNPVVDAMVEKILTAETKEQLVTASRALDMVLLFNYYVIPNWHLTYFRIIYRNKFGRPKIFPKYALGFENWWLKQDSAIRGEKKAGQ